MHEYRVKIPEERIAVLIGEGGETKRELQRVSGTELDVDSQEGLVTIQGEDAIDLYDARDVVKAIGRGFNPKIAQMLLRQDYTLDIIKVRKVVQDSQQDRAKGRVIGKDGKTRRMLENMTETFISVYGKTIGVIGELDRVKIVREGIIALLQGAQHGAIYDKIQEEIKELERRELINT